MNSSSAHISSEFFREWRSPRRGSANPSVMTNDLWTWIVAAHNDDNEPLSAYQVNKTFQGPSSMNAGPCWCFDRFGQTKTELLDGRMIYVAGEHEDFYDPDFYIYNDVVVIEPTGMISIFGYPVDVFPPTDFHSATLVSDSLILIGNLSYAKNRLPGQTQVLRLELDSWRVSPIVTTGDCPGWIHKHKAILSGDGKEILVTQGRVDHGYDNSFVKNVDDWSLDLRTFRWSRLTKRNWPQFELHRKDKKRNHLEDIDSLRWCKEYELEGTFEIENKLKQELGVLPDLKTLETLYVPAIASKVVEKKGDKYGVHRVRVCDVIVCYIQNDYSICVTVEGELSELVVEEIKKDIMEKFSILERTEIVCRCTADEDSLPVVE